MPGRQDSTLLYGVLMFREAVEAKWFKENAPDWELSNRQDFYVLFNLNNPTDGIIWFMENLECYYFRMTIDQVPENVQEKLRTLNLPLYEPEKKQLPPVRVRTSAHFVLSTPRAFA